jgi:hypothetical protein
LVVINREKWNVNVCNVKMVMMAVGFALRCGCICVCSSLSFPYLSFSLLSKMLMVMVLYQISNIKYRCNKQCCGLRLGVSTFRIIGETRGIQMQIFAIPK